MANVHDISKRGWCRTLPTSTLKKIRSRQRPARDLSGANIEIKNKKNKFFRHYFCFYVIFAVLLYYERDKNNHIYHFNDVGDGL